MNYNESNPQGELPPPRNRTWNLGNKTLGIIWALFLAYIALIFYFFYHYGSQNTVAEGKNPTPAILETNPADSLLGMFFHHFEAGEYDKAREIAGTLKERYPETAHARRAADLMATIDGQEDTPPVVQREEQPATDTSPKQQTRTAPVTRRSTTRPSAPPVQFDTSVLEAALAKMRKERDNQRGITWYYNKNISHYVYKNSFEAYIGQNDEGDIWLRMRIYYNGDKPLDIEAYEINVNDRDYPVSTLYGKLERGKGSGGAWEWYDAQVSRKEMRMIEAVMQPGPTEIRYIGKSGNFRRMMTEPEKLRLKNIMEAYQALTQQQSYLSSLVQ